MFAMAAIMMVSASAQNYQNSRYYNAATNTLEYAKQQIVNGITVGDCYYGFRIGPSFSTVNSSVEGLKGGDSQTGICIGMVGGVPLSMDDPLYLELGLLYNEKGGKNVYDGDKLSYDLNYLEVPLVVKYIYDVDGQISLQPMVGCYLSYGIGGKWKNYDEEKIHSSYSCDFKHFDSGLRIGCGVGYDIFYAELTYDIGLTNVYDNDFHKTRNGCLSIAFGVNF